MSRLLLLTVLLLGLSLIDAKAMKAPGNPKAIQGGTFLFNLGSTPPTLHPLSSTDYYASIVQGYMIEGLLTRDPDTYEWVPALAKDWKISKDGKTFTFTLRDGVLWSDGKPVTVEDVKFSFDAIVDPENKYKTAHMTPYYENIEKVEIVDNKTVRFHAKNSYFKNFDVAAGLSIVPKHVYENPSKKQKKKLNKTVIGSGPYVVKSFKRGQKIVLEKNPKWWGLKDPYFKGSNNYKRVFMKFIKNDTIAIEMLKKSKLDFLGLTPEDYTKKATGKMWGKDVFKKKVENDAPQGYSFIGWNLKNPIFQSRNVRLALYHLVNRELMIKKFESGMSEMAIGPWYKKSIYADNSVKPILFNADKAIKLFRKDGWKDSDGDGILDKVINGQKRKMSFEILEPRKEFEKYLTIFKEDAKKVGVDVRIKLIEWSSFLKLLDEKKFDAVRLGWSGGSVDIDPKQIWHSESARAGGSNFISYSNPKVDKLIDEARFTMDKKARVKKLKKVFREIAKDVPYVFFFNKKYSLYAHTKKMKMDKDTYNYSIGYDYWWIEK
jgi:peptide/nickel transport system substrate-binding protein/microcin C transport system substrate-binding protein